MGTLLSTLEPCFGETVLPYSVDEINSVMIDFIMGQLPEQTELCEDDDLYASPGRLHSVDMFLHIFGEPKVMKVFGENYLFYYQLKDHATLVITVTAFAYDINRVHINDYVAC